ncbi:MAG TPA: GntR family transcriptional regulator [Novosphingobium sp.]|nr:GntR family transcriptional regulator [Novosphingobium sp.]HMP55578.1 GntR family transcriptional regulator [Novosphingobium sp.]
MANGEVRSRALSGKTRAICDAIEQRLVRGAYKFGQEILATDLVREFDASRAPVMAALNFLRAEGYLIITPQVGCRVIAPTTQEIEDYFFVYGRLESAMTFLAAQRRTDEEVEELRFIQSRVRAATPGKGDMISSAFVDKVADFHRKIHAMSHSKYEAERAERYWRMSEFFLFNGNKLRIEGGDPLETANREREDIVEAIARRDAEAAALAMEKHVRGKPRRADVVGFTSGD